jgi:hypothetical protein
MFSCTMCVIDHRINIGIVISGRGTGQKLLQFSAFVTSSQLVIASCCDATICHETRFVPCNNDDGFDASMLFLQLLNLLQSVYKNRSR